MARYLQRLTRRNSEAAKKQPLQPFIRSKPPQETGGSPEPLDPFDQAGADSLVSSEPGPQAWPEKK